MAWMCNPPPPVPNHLFDAAFGNGVGASPIWTSSAYLRPVMHQSLIKVLWLLEPGSTNRVTLWGWNLLTGKPVRFNIPSMGITGAIRARLDRSKGLGASSSTVPEGWLSFPSSLTLPSSGFYVLFAQWRTGSWILPFAAGR